MDVSGDFNEIEPKDVDFFRFTSLVADAKVSLQDTPFNTIEYPASVSLLAIGNKIGKFAAVTTQGFVFASTKDLRETFYAAGKGATVPFSADSKIEVPVKNPIRQIRFSADESELIVVSSQGNISIYKVVELESNKSATKPAKEISIGDSVILDVRPNPEVYPNLVALLSESKNCTIIDKDSGDTVCNLPVDDATAICWSPRGKQIVCGRLDGSLQCYDIQASCKDVIPIPEKLKAGQPEEPENRFVQDILWIENNIFLVIYARKRQEPEDEFIHDAYLINRKPKSATSIEYSCLPEVAPAFTTEGRGYHFYMETIRGLGKEIEHLVIVANAASSEVSVVGNGGLDGKEWATWMLSEAGSASLPLSNVTSLDTYPVGAALDFTADEELPPIDATTETKAQAVPIFYYLTDEGLIRGFHCQNVELARRGESYKAAAQLTAPTPSAPIAPSAAIPTTATTTNPAPASAFASAFASSTPSSAFSDLLSGKTSSPASTAPESKPFGSFASLGANAPSFSSLGASVKPVPKPNTAVFGASSGFGGANPATAPMTFGSPSSFGTSPSANTTGSFGKSSSFGANPPATSTTGTATKPFAFGQPSTFGASPAANTANNTATTAFSKPLLFGSSSNTVADSGSKPAVTTSNDPATTSFGKPSLFGAKSPVTSTAETATKPSAFGQSSLFGTKPATSTVETASEPSASGQSSLFGAKPAATSAQNTASKPSAFGQSSLFGAKPTTLTAETAKEPSALGQSSLFGTKPAATSAENTASKPSAFGQPSLFGTSAASNTTSAFGKPSSFGATPTTKTPADTAKTSALNSTSDTAASALDKLSLLGSSSSDNTATANASNSPLPGATPTTTTINSAPTATSGKTATLASTTTAFSATAFGAGASNQSEPSTTTPATTAPASSAVYPSTKTTPANATKTSTTAPTSESASVASKKDTFMPTAKDGMAKEYENVYMAVKAETDKLKEYSANLNKIMKIHTEVLEIRTKASLTDEDMSWNLNDISNLNNLTKELLTDTERDEEQVREVKASVESLVDGLTKLLEKKEEINYLLQSNANEKIVDIMENRELDAETKTTLLTLESKTEAYDDLLKKLEWRLLEHEKREKIRNRHSEGQITLYSFHRAIRDIELDTRRKKKDLDELEETLAHLTLNESKRRAKQASIGYTFEDLTDSESEEDEPSVSAQTIKQTTMYIRRYHFMDKVCNGLNDQAPLHVSAN